MINYKFNHLFCRSAKAEIKMDGPDLKNLSYLIPF